MVFIHAICQTHRPLGAHTKALTRISQGIANGSGGLRPSNLLGYWKRLERCGVKTDWRKRLAKSAKSRSKPRHSPPDSDKKICNHEIAQMLVMSSHPERLWKGKTKRKILKPRSRLQFSPMLSLVALLPVAGAVEQERPS